MENLESHSCFMQILVSLFLLSLHPTLFYQSSSSSSEFIWCWIFLLWKVHIMVFPRQISGQAGLEAEFFAGFSTCSVFSWIWQDKSLARVWNLYNKWTGGINKKQNFWPFRHFECQKERGNFLKEIWSVNRVNWRVESHVRGNLKLNTAAPPPQWVSCLEGEETTRILMKSWSHGRVIEVSAGL